MNELFCLEDLKDEIQKVENRVGSKGIELTDGIDWICPYVKIIIMALKIAIIFVGRKEKEILKAIIEGLKNQCDI